MGYLDNEEYDDNPIFSEEQRRRMLLGIHAPDLYPSINNQENQASLDYIGNQVPSNLLSGDVTGSPATAVGPMNPSPTGRKASIYEPGPNESAYSEALSKPRPEYQQAGKMPWWKTLLEIAVPSTRALFTDPEEQAQRDYERRTGAYEGDIAQKRGAANLELQQRAARAPRKNLIPIPEGTNLYDPIENKVVASGGAKQNEIDKEFQDWSPTHPGKTKLDYLEEKTQELGAAGERGRQSVPLRQPATSPDDQDAFDAYAEKNKIVGRPLSATEKEAARAAHQQLIHPKDMAMEQANLALKRLAIQNAQAKNPNIDFSKPLPNAADEVVANLLAQGKTVPSLLSKRTGDYNAVTARAAAINPNLDLALAESNFRAGNQNQKQIRSFDAVNASLDNVLQTSKEFQRTNIGLLNDIILKGEVATNDPKAIRFQSAVTGVIDDAASALSGGGAVTDAARNQATRLFRSSYSQGGMEAAIDEVRNLISKRREAFSAGTVYDKNRGAAQRNRAEETLPDGSVWKKNPDGSRTRIK